MTSFYEFLESRLNERGLSFYKLNFLAQIPSSHFSQWKKGARKPSQTDLEKLASVEELGLSLEQLMAASLIDRYPAEVLRRAVELVEHEQATEKTLKKVEKKGVVE